MASAPAHSEVPLHRQRRLLQTAWEPQEAQRSCRLVCSQRHLYPACLPTGDWKWLTTSFFSPPFYPCHNNPARRQAVKRVAMSTETPRGAGPEWALSGPPHAAPDWRKLKQGHDVPITRRLHSPPLIPKASRRGSEGLPESWRALLALASLPQTVEGPPVAPRPPSLHTQSPTFNSSRRGGRVGDTANPGRPKAGGRFSECPF